MANTNVDIERLIKQLQQLDASTAEIRAVDRAFKELAGDSEAVADEIERVRKRVEQLRAESANISTPFADLNKILQENATVLSKQHDTLSLASKAQNKIASISRDMVSDYQGLTDLSKRQLESKLEDLVTSQAQLAVQAQRAKQEAKELQYTKGKSKAQIKRMEQLREVARLTEQQDVGLTGLIGRTKERLALETSINENMGVAGALVGGTGALMERLGMRSGIFHQAMEQATDEMRTMAKDMGTNVSFMNKLKVAATGVSKILQGFGKALLDPTSIGLKLLDVFFKINKQSVEISRLTGQLASNFDTSVFSAASMVDQMEVVAELTKQTGLSAQAAFSRENIQGAANLKVEMGLAADEAGTLAMMAQTSNTNVDALTDSIVQYTNEFNGSNRTAVAHGVVLRDIGKASESVRASFGGSTKALVAAAGAARKLGMEIGDLDSIANNLLDFESSIGAELEAQLLTGKNINMNKARELALNNELGDLGEELYKNSSSLAEFGQMNRIQQEAQAKALGMTRDQLAKVAYQRGVQLKMSDEELKKATGVEASDMRRLEAQENFTKALEKIAASLAPILDFFGNILSIPWVPQILLGAVALGKLGANILPISKGFGSMAKGIKDIGGSIKSSGLLDLISDKAKGVWDKIKDAFNSGANPVEDVTESVQDKAKDVVTDTITGKVEDTITDKASDGVGGVVDASDKTKNVKPGKNIKTFLKNLAEGLKEMASMKVLYGALNLIPASLGLVAMIPGVVGAKLMELINGAKLQESMYGLAFGLQEMGKGKTMLGALGLVLASAGFIAMIPGAIGMGAIALLGEPTSVGLKALAKGLTVFGTAMAGPAGLGLLAFVGAAIGLGAAFALVGAGAMMFGKGIQFAAIGVVSIFTGLIGLISSIPQLYLLGMALMSIAAGLGAIAFAGIAAIPALAALSGFALMATPLIALGGLFGDGGGNEDDGFAKLEAKLDTLISVISQGGDVYLDSDKVGRTQAKSFSKLTGS